MIKAERQQAIYDKEHDRLSSIAQSAERTAIGAAILGVVAAGLLSGKDRSFSRSKFIGLAGIGLAFAAGVIASICDVKITAINKKDGLY